MVNDEKEWVQNVNITKFGSGVIQPGSIVKITLYLMNPLTAYSLSQKAVRVTLINLLGQTLSKGSYSLAGVYPNLNSFIASQLSSYLFRESNKICGQSNVLNITISIPIDIAPQTFLYIILPNAYYTFANQMGYAI